MGTGNDAPGVRARRYMLAIGGVAALAAGLMLVVLGPGTDDAAAQSGPCGTANDDLSSAELEFLGHFRDWRAQENLVRSDLEVSGALNAAAQWFAEDLLANDIPGGHYDSLGRHWVERLLDCGYTGTTNLGQPLAYGSGEGTFALLGSGNISVTPYEAVHGGSTGGYQHSGVTYPGSGAYQSSSSPSIPSKCVGVGHATSSNGVAWIVLVAQWYANQPCPESSAQGVDPTPTPTTAPTDTPSPTPTTTPTPGPEWQSVAPSISRGVAH